MVSKLITFTIAFTDPELRPEELDQEVVQLLDIYSVSIISQMQTEIRGLRVENQRILEQMFSE